MKKIIYTLSVLSIMLTSCVIDNYEGPDASFFGSIKDSKTGALVETDLIDGTTLEVYEIAYENPSAQKWVVKNNGEFRNDMVFANDYDIYIRNGNVYPQEYKAFTINKGENEFHFSVTPFIRIINPEIIYNKENNKIVATFYLEGGKGTEIVDAVRLYAFSDIYVGEPVKFNILGGTDSKSNLKKEIDPTEKYELSIDLNRNSEIFKEGRDYFFRIGALADIEGVGTIRHNYAPFVKISL